MDFNQMLDSCENLQKIIVSKIQNNAREKAELYSIQEDIIESSTREFDQLAERENDLSEELENLKLKKQDLDTDIKQFREINEKLENIAQSAEKARNEKKINVYEDQYIFVAETINQFEQLKADFGKAKEEYIPLIEEVEKDIDSVNRLVKENNELNVKLRSTSSVLLNLEQENRHMEQHFDLILNQLPWDPLSDRYLFELSQSSEKSVRDMAEVLQLQASNINEIYTSLDLKKKKKLELLRLLAERLDNFVKKRDEATLMYSDYNSDRMSFL